MSPQSAPPQKRTGTIDRQQAIYTGGMAGKQPTVPVDYRELETAASRSMSPAGHAYIAGGAGRESTMAENRAAFERWRIVPRMLRDVSERNTSIELFGRRYPRPFLLCPIGVLEMAHPEADVAVARAAAKTGTPMIFSNQASRSMEECSAAMDTAAPDAPRWFQLYWSKSDALVESLVSRAEACNCDALVVTLDTTLLGWRTRDLDLAHLPFLLGQGIAQYTSDPVFRASLAEVPDDGPRPAINGTTLKNVLAAARSYPGSSLRALTSGQALAAVRQFIATYSRPNLTWADLAWLRKRTRLPIVLKGILDGADARLAAEHGVDGLIVSNHGGRQVDGARASLDALPEVVAAAPDLPVILDSGIRGGADVFKALALGATAVGLGRPYAYGLAVAGEEGVRDAIDNLAADFELTMALAGCSDINAIRSGTSRVVANGATAPS